MDNIIESPKKKEDIFQDYYDQNSKDWNNVENWNKFDNLRTIFGWITISALNIECLDEAIKRYRKFIAYGTILGLLCSTASGTISATRINQSVERAELTTSLNVLFTILSFTITIYTGILKILQVQERLETFIKIKQEWILFSASISSELQLPIHVRKPILAIISVYKTKFLDLLKIDAEIPEFIKKDIINKIKQKEEEKYKNEKWDDLKYSEASSLSDVIIEIGSRELKRLICVMDDAIKPPTAATLDIEMGRGGDDGGRATIGIEPNHIFEPISADSSNSASSLKRIMSKTNMAPDFMASSLRITPIMEEKEMERVKRDTQEMFNQFAIAKNNLTSSHASSNVSLSTTTKAGAPTNYSGGGGGGGMSGGNQRRASMHRRNSYSRDYSNSKETTPKSAMYYYDSDEDEKEYKKDEYKKTTKEEKTSVASICKDILDKKLPSAGGSRSSRENIEIDAIVLDNDNSDKSSTTATSTSERILNKVRSIYQSVVPFSMLKRTSEASGDGDGVEEEPQSFSSNFEDNGHINTLRRMVDTVDGCIPNLPKNIVVPSFSLQSSVAPTPTRQSPQQSPRMSFTRPRTPPPPPPHSQI